MRTTVTVALLASVLALPAIAQNNLYELAKQEKSERLVVTKSVTTIEISPRRAYDKYIISISGDGGFSYQVESKSPVLDIYALKLPYDGSYNYEIKAVKNVTEVRDTMNNGRAAGAVGKISVIDVTSGQFKTVNGEMSVIENKQEPRLSVLPSPTLGEK